VSKPIRTAEGRKARVDAITGIFEIVAAVLEIVAAVVGFFA
jgi:hypothetical protein